MLVVLTGAEDHHPEVAVGAAGGYESNLGLAASGQPSFGSGVVSAWAGAGLSTRLTDKTDLYAGARYDGAAYSDVADLNRNTLGATLLLSRALTDRVSLLVIPDLGYAWYGNSARNSLVFLGKALIRVKPVTWFTVRAGYARLQRSASDPAYSIGANRFLASIEARLASGSYLALGYSLQVGDQVFYRDVSSAGGGGFGGMGPGSFGEAGHGGSGMFASLVPYRATATQSTLSPTWEHRLWEGLYITASYGLTWGSSGGQRYTAQSFYGGANYRF